jgi:hypothetical protein
MHGDQWLGATGEAWTSANRVRLRLVAMTVPDCVSANGWPMPRQGRRQRGRRALRKALCPTFVPPARRVARSRGVFCAWRCDAEGRA